MQESIRAFNVKLRAWDLKRTQSIELKRELEEKQRQIERQEQEAEEKKSEAEAAEREREWQETGVKMVLVRGSTWSDVEGKIEDSIMDMRRKGFTRVVGVSLTFEPPTPFTLGGMFHAVVTASRF